MNITCAEGVIENQKEYMQPIVNIDDIELALGTENTSCIYKMFLFLYSNLFIIIYFDFRFTRCVFSNQQIKKFNNA